MRFVSIIHIALLVLTLAAVPRSESATRSDALVAVSRPTAGNTVGAEPVAAKSSVYPPRLIVDDGQLSSHQFIVFVTYPLAVEMNPELSLTSSQFIGQSRAYENVDVPATNVLPHQYSVIPMGSASVPVEGTLLTFDLSKLTFPFYDAAALVRPTIKWSEPSADPGDHPVRHAIAASDEIYLGNLPAAVAWTLITVGLVALAVIVWSYQKANQFTQFRQVRPSLLLITGPDGFLSLWRAQLLLWTVAVGGMVFMYGLLRMHVPDIPSELVVLMGMSLLTGTVSAAKGRMDANAQTSGTPAPTVDVPVDLLAGPVLNTIPAPLPSLPPPPLQINPGKARFADLISNWNSDLHQVELSLPKAQMVFWTVIVLGLFVVKSLLSGGLWEVPWAMVALTGFSQAGYVGDKFVKSI